MASTAIPISAFCSLETHQKSSFCFFQPSTSPSPSTSTVPVGRFYSWPISCSRPKHVTIRLTRSELRTFACLQTCALLWLARAVQLLKRPQPHASAQVGASESDSSWRKLANQRDAFWRFLRPHTIRGTIFGSTAMLARALIENPNFINWLLLPRALTGLLALICGNGYIVGINQIYDIEIDKINKPYLPIAAADFSVSSAWALVLALAAIGFVIAGLNFGPFLSALYTLGLVLGTIYSVPPFRLKRFPIVAFLIIATVRGFLLNFGLCYASRAVLGLTFEWSAPDVFITTFMTLFALVISITKDLPDVEGDRKFQIPTFATKVGVRNISFLGCGILLVNYLGAILAAIYRPKVFRCNLMVTAHAAFALTLIWQVWVLHKANYTKEANSRFYRFIWYLFYAEYIIFPFI